MSAPAVTRQERVKQELIEAGMTRHGLMKSSSQYLYNVMHDDEHVKAVVFSIYGGTGPIMVATEHRIIYLAHKPSYTTCDDIAYDSVLGVTISSAGLLGNLSLRVRNQSYTMGYINRPAAQRFLDYIESRDLGYEPVEASSHETPPERTKSEPGPSSAAFEFLAAHDMGVLSTVDRTGNVHGATVYYLVDEAGSLYLLTRSETAKARNILAHQQVALTVSDEDTMSTLQLQADAEVVIDELVKSAVFTQMTKPRAYMKGKRLPPVTSLEEGVFVIVRIIPTELKLRRYES